MNDYLVIANHDKAGFIFNAQAMDKGKNWPKEYDCSFIEPGLINYDDMGAGNCLVRKEALDKMANSFKGRPVLFRKHGDATPENFEEIACGIVNEVYFNAADSWYHAKFFVWDDATKAGIESGKFSVSCAYVPSDTDLEGGIYNNINYDMEVKNGEYTHLAIVENPRYNGAKIFINSKGGKGMKETVKKALTELSNAINSMFGKEGKPDKEVKNDGETDAARLDKIIGLLEKLMAGEEAEKMEASAPKEELTGKEDKEKEEKKNAEEADKKKKEDEEKKNAEDEEKKKKDEDEKKNAEDEEKKKKDEEEKKNSEHFNALKEKANSRGGIHGDMSLNTKEDRRAAGKSKYGSEKIEGGR
jgi:hypothetical protein